MTDTLTTEQAGAALLRLALEPSPRGHLADALALSDEPAEAVLAAFLLAAHLLRSCPNAHDHEAVASRLTLNLYTEP